MGMTEAVKESIYLLRFLEEIGYEDFTTITLFNDNKGALKLAENPVLHNRSKHIDLRYHFIRDAVKQKLVKVEHLGTEDMLADLLTKGLSGPQHIKLMDMMKLMKISTTA